MATKLIYTHGTRGGETVRLDYYGDDVYQLLHGSFAGEMAVVDEDGMLTLIAADGLPVICSDGKGVQWRGHRSAARRK